jgi:hypothetical protein
LKALEENFYDLSTFGRGGDEMQLEGAGLLQAVKAAKPDILIGQYPKPDILIGQYPKSDILIGQYSKPDMLIGPYPKPDILIGQ